MNCKRITIGEKICALRVAKGMTQEQLAEILCISPAAISKWERNLSNPSIEMLWAMADYFGCSIDELVGRDKSEITHVGVLDDNKIQLVETAETMIKLCQVCRQEGFFAMDERIKHYQEGNSFLSFAVKFFLDSFLKRFDREMIFMLLRNYAETLPERERIEGKMITEGLEMITAGECPEILREVLASYIGMGYWEKLISDKKYTREDIMVRVSTKGVYSEKTTFLEGLSDAEEFLIRTIIKNMEQDILVAALVGASGSVNVRFLKQIKGRVLHYLYAEIECWKGTEEDIIRAQRSVLELVARIQREME